MQPTRRTTLGSLAALVVGLTLVSGLGCDNNNKGNFGPGSGSPVTSGGGGGGGGGGIGSVGSLSAATAMNRPRYAHTATLLPADPNNRILVVCGFGNGGLEATAELYQPNSGSTGAWTRVDSISPTTSAGFLTEATSGQFTARARHTATALLNGRVLITGGYGVERYSGTTPIPANGEALKTAFLFDPTTNAFTQTGSMSVNRQLHNATLLNSGKVLVAGGIDNTAGTNVAGVSVKTCETYDPNTGMWTNVGDMTGVHTSGTLVNTGSQVIIAGGASIAASAANAGSLSGPASLTTTPRAEAYNETSATWSSLASPTADRSFVRGGRMSGTTQMMLAGGQGTNYDALASTEVWSPTQTAWIAGPTMATARGGVIAIEIGSTSDMLLIGGYDNSLTAVRTIEVYSVLSNFITGTLNMTDARSDHAAAPIGTTGKTLICGGVDAGGNVLTSAAVHSR